MRIGDRSIMRAGVSSALRSAAGRQSVVSALASVLASGCTDPTGPSATLGRPDVAAGEWAAVTVGDDFSCALDRGGRAYCWGDNTFGQLAVGDTARVHPSPRAVVGGLTFRSIVAGSGYVCALTAAGEAYCWGNNGSGELGLGATGPGYRAPVTTPTPVATTVRFAQLTAAAHTCGVALDGATYCWGPGGEGQLGVGPVGPCGPGDRESYDTFRRACVASVPTPVAGGLRFASVSAGSQHTCGVTTEGAAYCWGFNHDGVLGTARVAYDCPIGYSDPDPNAAAAPCRQFTPVAVATALRFRQVTAGGPHTCGLAVDGRAYCWGLATGLERGAPRLQRSAAALGTGSIAPGGSVTPVPVAGGLTFRALFLRDDRSCGVTADDRAYCWGGNGWGTLGFGAAGPRWAGSPHPVLVPLVAGAPVTGGRVGCVATTTGRIFCWGGLNFLGELGNGAASPYSLSAEVFEVPAPIAPPTS